MRQRAPLVLSITALVVAVLGVTPLGQATAKRLSAVVPPFAKTAGFARLADNSNKLNGHRSTLRGLAGTIAVVGANGKLPASIGAVGPQGPQGPAGSKGDRGPAGPTFGASTANANPNSYTTMAEIGNTVDVKFDSAGTLFAFGRVQATLVCTANQTCSRHFGLYVDGQQVEGTLVEVHSYGNTGSVGTTDNFAVFGTKAVSAGTHTIRFRAGNNPNVLGFVDVGTNVGGIALGNS